jgi:hypothetical protein
VRDAGHAVTIDQAAVLARWQKTRSPRLADLLCCVPPERGWAARLERISEVRWKYALPEIEALPDDPRTTVFLVAMLDDANWLGPDTGPLWKVVFERLVALRDVRCLAHLRALATNPPRFFQAKFTRWAAGEIAKTADRLARVKVAKDDAATTRLADAQTVRPPKQGFFKRGPSPESEALIARVWENPEDLELRAVIGDALLELGDPWGELIALQLAKKPNAKAIRALLEAHLARFAGPISHVHNGLVFEAGFLASGRIWNSYATTRDWDEAATAPHWATVKRVDFGSWCPKQKWVRAWWSSANLTSLRELAICGVVFARASASEPWSIEKAPAQIREVDADDLERMLGAMPGGSALLRSLTERAPGSAAARARPTAGRGRAARRSAGRSRGRAPGR